MNKYFPILCMLFLWACQSDDETNTNNNNVTDTLTTPSANLIIKFVFDSTQIRLDNLGKTSTINADHATQSPNFKEMSAHYIELVPDKFTQVKQGSIVFQGEETSIGGSNAVDFSKAIIGTPNTVFQKFPLKNIPIGSYEYLRVSLTFQKFLINYLYAGNDYKGTLSSFVGFNNYITQHTIDQQTIQVNNNKKQGFWAFETLGYTYEGQSAEGGTTVPNPIADSSPIPEGSCLVTGTFSNKFEVTGKETEDIILEISLSNNNSFEWKEVTKDGKYEPNNGEVVVDMGIRGLIPNIIKTTN